MEENLFQTSIVRVKSPATFRSVPQATQLNQMAKIITQCTIKLYRDLVMTLISDLVVFNHKLNVIAEQRPFMTSFRPLVQ